MPVGQLRGYGELPQHDTPMQPATVAAAVAVVAAAAHDPEVAHSCEDDLMRQVLTAIARGQCADPPECARLALQTMDLDFPRWCA